MKSTADLSLRAARRTLMPLGAFALLSLSIACQPEVSAAPKQAEAPPVSVETVIVGQVKSPVYLRLTGVLHGARETELAANVAGRVLKTSVERGDPVEAGTLLAQVDTKAAQLALAEAKVSVETSRTQQEINRKDCERYEQLRNSGAVTDLEYDQVTAKCKTAPLSVDAARAREQIAAKNVGDGTIRSPFSGVVTERFVEVGEYVQASSRVVSLAQVDSLKLVFQVPEKNFPDVTVGEEARFTVAAYADQKFPGKVTRISGAVSSTRDVTVEAEVENKDHKLLPGMFTDIELKIGEEPVLAVPESAVFEHNGKLNILVVKDGMLEQRVVQVLPNVGALTPVRRGLNEADRVVKSANPQLKNGQKVL